MRRTGKIGFKEMTAEEEKKLNADAIIKAQEEAAIAAEKLEQERLQKEAHKIRLEEEKALLKKA